MSALSFSILRSRNFRLFLLVRIFTIMAMQAQAVIVGWQVYSLSNNVLLLGLIGLTEAVPALVCSLFSGHVVDITRPHRTYIVCLSGLALNAVFLLILAGGYTPLAGAALLPWIFAAIFISGVLRSFYMPAGFSLLGLIAPRERMSAAQAWTSSGFQFAAVTGPAVAGLIYGGYGPAIAWLMPTLLLCIAVILLIAINGDVRHRRNSRHPESALKSIRAGWAFILGSPVLLSVMALDMFAVLFGGATAVLPAFADQVLHVGSEGLGLLRAAPAIGSVCMALWLAVRPMRNIRPALLLWVVTAFGLSMIGFGLSKTFALAAFFLILSGVFDSVSVIVRGTLIQWLTPDDMRGRVASVGSMFIISSNEIGAFESGTAARFLGLTPSIVVGGMATLLVVGMTTLLCPQFRHLTISADDKK